MSAPRRVPPCSCWVGIGYAVLLICQPLGRLASPWRGPGTRIGRCSTTLTRTAGAGSTPCADGSRRDHQPVYTMDAAGRVDAWDTDAATTPSRAVAPPCGCSRPAPAPCQPRAVKYQERHVSRVPQVPGATCQPRAASTLMELSHGRLLQVHHLREAAHARYAWEPRPESTWSTPPPASSSWSGRPPPACGRGRTVN